MLMLRSLVIRGAEAGTRLAGGRNRLLIISYHRVLDAPDPMYPGGTAVAGFRAHMQILGEDFNVIALGEARARLFAGDLPPRALAITFDDGYADNYRNALPVLLEHGLPATFFITTGYLDGGVMFNDCVIEACRHAPAGQWDTRTPELGMVRVPESVSRTALADELIARIKYLECGRRRECAWRLLESVPAASPRDLMMTSEQVCRLHSAGMEIGAHTRNHPILRLLDPDSAEREVVEGRSDLEAIIGQSVDIFAYPNGRPGSDYGVREVAILKRLGFRVAVTTAWGYADRNHDPLQLPRVGVWASRPWKVAGSLAWARLSARGDSCEAAC
jgi:peptidoglycan/xylan/chitin deacetylase (PgdA/CDA1 family)